MASPVTYCKDFGRNPRGRYYLQMVLETPHCKEAERSVPQAPRVWPGDGGPVQPRQSQGGVEQSLGSPGTLNQPR